MKMFLQDELSCPCCEGNAGLHVEDAIVRRDDDFDRGMLACGDCDSRYPVVDGVAVLATNWEALLRDASGYLARAVLRDTVPDELQGAFPFAGAVDALIVPEEVEPYVFNHLCFAGEGTASNPVHEVRSPMLLAQIKAAAASGPYEIVRREVVARPGARHLDIGCSVGTAVSLSARSGTEISVGVDLSFPSVHVGRALSKASAHGARSELIVGDAANLPLKAARWSLVSALNVFDELAAPGCGFAQMDRMLAPGGCLTLVAPFRNVPAELPRDRLVSRGSSRDLPWVILRGPRLIELLSVDAYYFERPLSAR